jgi:hypothetical protein
VILSSHKIYGGIAFEGCHYLGFYEPFFNTSLPLSVWAFST